MRIPRRILVILEGEGLANDATALISLSVRRGSLSCVGAFSVTEATETFAVIVGGEILWGIGVGWAMLRLRRWTGEPRIEITLAVLTPFMAYWPPEHLGGSRSILATVATGLYVSWMGPRLITAATRLQGIFFWGLLIYLIEGMVFLVTGLQARTLINRTGDHHLSGFLLAAVIVSAVVIVARFIWNYPAAFLPRRFNFWIRRKDPIPPWQWVFTVSFTGIRGIVSLAAALSLPLTTVGGQPFPDRDLILVHGRSR